MPGSLVGPIRERIVGETRRMNRVYQRKQMSLLCSLFGRGVEGGSSTVASIEEAGVLGGMAGAVDEEVVEKKFIPLSSKGGMGAFSGCEGGEEVPCAAEASLKGVEASSSCRASTVIEEANGTKNGEFGREKSVGMVKGN